MRTGAYEEFEEEDKELLKVVTNRLIDPSSPEFLALDALHLRGNNPLSPPSAPVQRRLQAPHAKSKFLAAPLPAMAGERHG